MGDTPTVSKPRSFIEFARQVLGWPARYHARLVAEVEALEPGVWQFASSHKGLGWFWVLLLIALIGSAIGSAIGWDERANAWFIGVIVSPSIAFYMYTQVVIFVVGLRNDVRRAKQASAKSNEP